jgi:hypothetical protein
MAVAATPATGQDFPPKTCTLEAPGDACIFDLTTIRAGSLRVCTTASRNGDRWRSTIARTNTNGAQSAVGTGSTTNCTGAVTVPVVSGGNYEAIITYERPLPGIFPKNVRVTFSGPLPSVPNPRRNRTGTIVEACGSDGQLIQCGSLVTCSFSPSGDTDTFRFDAPVGAAALVKICGVTGDSWQIFSPSGDPLCFAFEDGVCRNLPANGRYSILTGSSGNSTGNYNLMLQGVSRQFNCGLQIAYGNEIRGGLTLCSEVDTYHFDGRSGQVVSIRVSGVIGDNWRLFDPAGVERGFGFEQGQVTLASNGTHTIAVASSGGGTGNYILSLQKVGGP